MSRSSFKVICFTLQLCPLHISLPPLKDFHHVLLKCFSQWDSTESTYPSYLYSRSRTYVKFKEFTLDFCVRSISPESLGRFYLNFTQMLFSVSQCAEPMTRLCKLYVRVTLKGRVIYPCVHSTSPKPFKRFSFNFTQMFLWVMRFAYPMTQLCRLKVKVTLQCHGNYSWISCPFHLLNHLLDFHLTLLKCSSQWVSCRINDSAMQPQSQGHTLK